MEGDRERWNATWREKTADPAPPATFVREHEALLPRSGRGLDIAGGAGRHALWMARRGLEVTMIDVSDVGLERAGRCAEASELTLRLVRVDLDVGELPPGPFDLVICYHFLDRAHRDGYVDVIAPGGVLVIAQPTRINLERHAKPGARFLVEPGELDAWAKEHGLELVVSREGWNAEGRHEAELIARKIGQGQGQGS